jgi:amino acid adenylation domain-containing protein
MVNAERLNCIERWLIGACQQLGLAVETPHDDFFEVGGSPLALAGLISLIENEFGAAALSADELIGNSAMREIAVRILQNTADEIVPAGAGGADDTGKETRTINASPEALIVYRELNNTTVPYPSESSLKELFERCAGTYGGKSAIVTQEREYSYREINQLANSLARKLKTSGILPGNVVGVSMRRSAELIIALLAIIKCGSAYLPLDSSWPLERLRLILTDAGCTTLLAEDTDRLAEGLPQCQVLPFGQDSLHALDALDADPQLHVPPDAIAYISFTSGTTGRPKGVPIQHRSVLRLVTSTNYVHLGPETVILQISPVTFDAATFEIWGALLNGGTCVLYPPRPLQVRELRRVLREGGVTVLFLTTALFNTIIDEAPEALDTVDTVLTGGEAYSEKHISTALDRYGPGRLVHVYGPTECTTFTTFHSIDEIPSDRMVLPIGRPIQNTRIYVVKNDSLCLPGDIGEIVVAGPGLSPGYLEGVGDLTQSFAEYKIGETVERVYRTGDYGYLLDTGDLVFQGRLDEQVKVNGYRIELSEVSRVLDGHPEIRNSYVTLTDGVAGEKALLAFVVPHVNDITPAGMRVYLKARLPAYMVPARVHCCSDLPLLANGKVDRAALLARLREPE